MFKIELTQDEAELLVKAGMRSLRQDKASADVGFMLLEDSHDSLWDKLTYLADDIIKKNVAATTK